MAFADTFTAHSFPPHLPVSMFEPQLIVELAALGLCAGFMAGLLGIGGGMMIAPFMTFILAQRGVGTDAGVKVGIATSMAMIVFTSLSSLRAHHQRGTVRWDIVKSLAPGIALGGALASAGVFVALKGQTVSLIFAAFVGLSATQMLLNRQPRPSRQLPGVWGQGAAGVAIGFLSGLVGAGGGFVNVPYMLAHNVAMISAVSTSAALGFPIAFFNSLGYIAGGWNAPGLPPWSLGYIWLPGLLVTASCSIWTAPLGAKMAHHLPVAALRRIFAVLLYSLCAYTLHKGLYGD